MKDNSAYAEDSFQKVSAPQRRGSYITSDLNVSTSYAKQNFDPSSSSREMRKILYYESMFSKMDSQDKIKKSTPVTAAPMNASSTRGKEGVLDNDRSGLKQDRHVQGLRKSSPLISSPSLEGLAQRVEQIGKVDTSQGHRINIENPMVQQYMGPKRDAISIKIKTQNLSPPGYNPAPNLNYHPPPNSDAMTDAYEDKITKHVHMPITKVTDISGTKISKMLGIDQISGNASGLSASQRQWIVPTFDVLHAKQPTIPSDDNEPTHSTHEGLGVKGSPSALIESHLHAQRMSGVPLSPKIIPNEDKPMPYSLPSVQDTSFILPTEKIPRKQHTRVSRFAPITEAPPIQAFPPPEVVLPTPIKQESVEGVYLPHEAPPLFVEQVVDDPVHEPNPTDEKCSTPVKSEPSFQEDAIKSQSYMDGDTDIIIHEQDMEIDSASKDDLDDEPNVKDDEDEDYVPDAAMQLSEVSSTKKGTKRKIKAKKGSRVTTPTVSTPSVDDTLAFETETPDAATEEQYAEPPQVVKPTRTRGGGRGVGKPRKRDSNLLDESGDSHPVGKAGRSSRGGARSGPASSKRHGSDLSGSKSDYHTSGHGLCNGTPERHLKKAFATTRHISVQEAEKIIDLYQQHNADLERLKRLILVGDLAEFGRVVLEEAVVPPPKKKCILDPRRIIAPQPEPPTVSTQPSPPEDPIELSIKFRLLKKLVGK